MMTSLAFDVVVNQHAFEIKYKSPTTTTYTTTIIPILSVAHVTKYEATTKMLKQSFPWPSLDR